MFVILDSYPQSYGGSKIVDFGSQGEQTLSYALEGTEEFWPIDEDGKGTVAAVS